MRRASSRAAAAALLLAAGVLAADEPPLPRPEGFVTDRAGVLTAAGRTRLESLLRELQAKTGAEIAVVTVDTTAPLDDFEYAMRLAEAWKPGRTREDTGVVFLVAVRDRRLRVLVGYGLEGILPDGLVGEIQDRAVLPSFRAGRFEDGIVRGVTDLAARIAADRGVTLGGVPPPETRGPPPGGASASWVVILLIVAFLVLYAMGSQSRHARRRRRTGFGGFGPFGGFGGGFGGGGGGFGGFGGGSFGGGGAGRSW